MRLGVDHIVGHESEDDHDQVDEVLRDGGAVPAPAEGGEDEEDGQPDDELVAHEHACRAHDEGDEAGTVGLLLWGQFNSVVEDDVLGVLPAHQQYIMHITYQ